MDLVKQGLGENMILAGGETCMGFFLDGDDAQQPVIMGLLPKYNKVKNVKIIIKKLIIK